MQNLPEQFIENMKKQLPEDEWEAFFACYENIQTNLDFLVRFLLYSPLY